MIRSSTIVAICALVLAVSAWNIRPLRAGTIEIMDMDIRLGKSFTKNINLQFPKAQYDRWKDINVIASITSLKMDDKLNFYFDYNVLCSESGCFLNFTFIRHTQIVNPDFQYMITVDYLLARGLRVSDLNFTSYQEHLMIMDLTTYDENNQLQNLSMKLPKNNQDALRLLLIPNGWSNVTRTGGIVYLYAMGNDMYMYVVHYMEDKSVAGHDNGDSMGWPEGVDHVKYKVLYFDWDYEPAEGCHIEDKWNLEDHYQSICKKGGNDLKWFYGFKRTKEFQIEGQFFQLRSGYSFSLTNVPSRYGILGFPFIATDQFIDLRNHDSKFRKYLMLGQSLEVLLVIAAVLFSGIFFYKITRKKVEGQHLQQLKQDYKASEGNLTAKSELAVETPSSILK